MSTLIKHLFKTLEGGTPAFKRGGPITNSENKVRQIFNNKQQ